MTHKYRRTHAHTQSTYTHIHKLKWHMCDIHIQINKLINVHGDIYYFEWQSLKPIYKNNELTHRKYNVFRPINSFYFLLITATIQCKSTLVTEERSIHLPISYHLFNSVVFYPNFRSRVLEQRELSESHKFQHDLNLAI